MAGFLGMGNFTKVGKGIKKEEQNKKRFFAFFDLYFAKLGSLIKLNLLFILFCIPVITIGPATAALMKIVKCYNEQKPVFLFSDFFDSFKQNFKQGFLMGIINIVVMVACYAAFIFYYAKAAFNAWYVIPLIFIIIVVAVAVFANFYIYLIIITVDLKLFAVIKNAIIFMFLGAKTNILTLIFAGSFLAGSFALLPYSIPLVLTLTFSSVALIVCYNSFQYIYKYLVKPYYDKTGIENPYEKTYDDETIFEDATE